ERGNGSWASVPLIIAAAAFGGAGFLPWGWVTLYSWTSESWIGGDKGYHPMVSLSLGTVLALTVALTAMALTLVVLAVTLTLGKVRGRAAGATALLLSITAIALVVIEHLTLASTTSDVARIFAAGPHVGSSLGLSPWLIITGSMLSILGGGRLLRQHTGPHPGRGIAAFSLAAVLCVAAASWAHATTPASSSAVMAEYAATFMEYSLLVGGDLVVHACSQSGSCSGVTVAELNSPDPGAPAWVRFVDGESTAANDSAISIAVGEPTDGSDAAIGLAVLVKPGDCALLLVTGGTSTPVQSYGFSKGQPCIGNAALHVPTSSTVDQAGWVVIAGTTPWPRSRFDVYPQGVLVGS
ncbi:MAG: hypothetical protein QOI81_320, partial [Actinomycetota bacterium]|nr:hypothetical protein [Actinomycetota bacterium]